MVVAYPEFTSAGDREKSGKHVSPVAARKMTSSLQYFVLFSMDQVAPKTPSLASLLGCSDGPSSFTVSGRHGRSN